jgi:malate dehydrogenase
VASDGSYDTKEGLITSFPVRSDGEKWGIVQNVPINEFARGKIDASINELDEERSLVSGLLPS